MYGIEIMHIQDYIIENNIKQVYISPSLTNFDSCHYFPKKYIDEKLNTIFFGVYRREDIIAILKHTGNIWIFWFDNDCNPNYVKRIHNVKLIHRRKEEAVHLTHCVETMKFLNYFKIKSEIIKINYNIEEKINYINNKNNFILNNKYVFRILGKSCLFNLDELFDNAFKTINNNIQNNITIENANDYKIAGEYSYEKKSQIMKSNFNQFSEKFITFILILKNRSNRFNIHIEYINKIKDFFKYADYIIVEDFGNDNINHDKINKNIRYFQVKTDVDWSRSKLINFGLSHVKTELSVIVDVDFIFPSDYMEKLIKCCNMTDFNNNILSLSCHETHDCYNTNSILRYAYENYGGIWIFNTELVKKCGGYNFDINGHGQEERELEERLKLFNIDTIYGHIIYEDVYILHLSHDNDTRISNNITKSDIIENLKKITYKYQLPIIKTNL